MEQNGSTFSYTYSAQQQAEVEKIRNKYTAPAEDKLEQLRQLDRKPGQKAKAWALTVGIFGALIMGSGMSLAMTDLGAALGLSITLSMVLGILIGLVGMALVALAYPVYNRVLEQVRKRIAPQILQLSDQLLKNQTQR